MVCWNSARDWRSLVQESTSGEPPLRVPELLTSRPDQGTRAFLTKPKMVTAQRILPDEALDFMDSLDCSDEEEPRPDRRTAAVNCAARGKEKTDKHTAEDGREIQNDQAHTLASEQNGVQAEEESKSGKLKNHLTSPRTCVVKEKKKSLFRSLWRKKLSKEVTEKGEDKQQLKAEEGKKQNDAHAARPEKNQAIEASALEDLETKNTISL